MKKLKTPVLFILLGASLLLNFIGCQKQQTVEPSSQQKQTTSAGTLSIARLVADSTKDYSIAMDKAIRYTTRFRDNKTAAEPIGYKVPVGGILQLLKRVQDNNVDITHITFYQAIDDDGNKKLVYVATKADGTDVLEYPKSQTITINGLTTTVISPACDLSNDIISGNVTDPNVLNGK